MPLVYTGPADIVVELKTLYRSGLSQDMASTARDDEDVEMFAEMMAMAGGEVAGLMRETQIATAGGAWLDQHARDRGLRRLLGETTEQLRTRLQLPPTAGTTSAILDAIKIIAHLDEIYLVELPRQSMYCDREDTLDRGERMGGGRGVVIALVPASAGIAASALVVVRTKISAGKIGQVEEYT